MGFSRGVWRLNSDGVIFREMSELVAEQMGRWPEEGRPPENRRVMGDAETKCQIEPLCPERDRGKVIGTEDCVSCGGGVWEEGLLESGS